MVRLLSVALCAALLQSVSAFVAAPSVTRASTSLNMKSVDDEKRFAASFLTAAYLFANVVSVAPAFAMGSDDFAGSTQVVAAKSGGRMGGRSAVGSRGSTASYARPTTTNVQRTTVRQTTIIAPPVVASPVYVAPPIYGGYGGGYGYGLDAGTVGRYSGCDSSILYGCKYGRFV
jgi:hypothetical protein